MPLAAILGVCLLLPWPQASIVLPATAVWQSAPVERESTEQFTRAKFRSATGDRAAKRSGSVNHTVATASRSTGCPAEFAARFERETRLQAEAIRTKTKKHHETHKAVAPAAPAPAGTTPEKKVVKDGGTDEPTVDLSPGVNQKQASEQAMRTDQLLASSDANLKKISGRQLSASQQDTVKQIKSYMEQATAAKNNGDMQRAYNLAVKANLLSAELAGP